jgi:hypothetical protein
MAVFEFKTVEIVTGHDLVAGTEKTGDHVQCGHTR